MEIQKTSNSQSNLKKEEWNWRKNLPLVSLKHLVPLRLGGCKQSHVARRTYTGGLDNLQRSP